MNYNPQIFTVDQLSAMTEKDILIAQYQLQLSLGSLFFAISIFVTVFLVLKWVLPKFWYLSRGSR